MLNTKQPEYKVERICAGEYEISRGDFVVSISKNEFLDYEFGQWIVSANWDRWLYTDPIIYFADAKAAARQMIADAERNAA